MVPPSPHLPPSASSAGHGVGFGALRVIDCNDGYLLSGSESASVTVVCNADGQWSDAKMTTCSQTTTTTTTSTTITTTTDAPWTLVYRQKNCAMRGSRGEDQGNEDEDCYSAFSKIATLQRADGKFEFKLRYPQKRIGLQEEDGPMLIWTQGNDPSKDLVLKPNTVVDFEPIEATDEAFWTSARAGGGFKGLSRSSRPDDAFIDGNPERSSWHYALGTDIVDFPASQYFYEAGFGGGACPTSKPNTVYETCWVELYVQA